MFIPQNVLQRIVPKENIRAVPGGIEIIAVNIITPIQVEDLPWENIVDYYDIFVDGVPIPRNIKNSARITILDYEYRVDNIRNLEGKVIPVGGKIKVFAPLTKYKKGETHDISLNIKLTNNPIQIKFKRTIQ